MRWGIQKGLLATQFYVDLWRALFPGVGGPWGLYDEGMQELGRLVFGAGETGETTEAAPDEAGAAASALAGLDFKANAHQCRMQTLLGELAGMGEDVECSCPSNTRRTGRCMFG
jgi:hypothetical protein